MTGLSLPKDVAPYQRTATFTAESVPKALLKDHATKSGVWGLIVVEAGELELVRTDDEAPPETLRTGDAGVIAPEERHRVKFLKTDGEFHIVFHKKC
jgi:tellurite resistance-related uncharacterized protein